MIPGIHINTIAEMLYNYGVRGFHGVLALYVIYGISVALEGIYAISLNIPDGATGIVPAAAQRLSEKGMTGKSIYSYLQGGVYGIIIAIALLPILFVVLPVLQQFAQENMFLILLFATSYILLSDASIANFIAFALAGILGMFIFGKGDYIFPMFTGFFTLPMLMIKTKQVDIEKDYKTSVGWKIPTIAAIATSVMYLIPGVATPTQIIILAGIFANIDTDDFITALGAINASNIIYSLLMTDIIHKGRTGVAIIAQNMFETGIYNHVVIVLAGAAVFLLFSRFSLEHMKEIVKFFRPFNTPIMKLILGIYITVLVYLTSGAMGVLVMGAACLVGVATLIMKARRTNLMGSIILNSLKYYYR